MTFHVFVTTPRAGFSGAITPYTVELRDIFATREDAQAFADTKPLSAAAKALLDSMPSAYPAWTSGVALATGAYRAYGGATWRVVQGHTTQAGWEPPNVPALWSKAQSPGSSAWDFPVWYAMSTPAPECTYGGRLYRLAQAHTSQSNWQPPFVSALWTDVGSAADVQPYRRATWWVVSSDDPDYTQVERAKEA